MLRISLTLSNITAHHLSKVFYKRHVDQQRFEWILKKINKYRKYNNLTRFTKKNKKNTNTHPARQSHATISLHVTTIQEKETGSVVSTESEDILKEFLLKAVRDPSIQRETEC